MKINELGALLLCSSLSLVVSCKKKDSNNTTTVQPPARGYVTDIDGNRYDTVHIGAQVWLKQNLRTAHYRDGSAINIGSAASWDTATGGEYGYFQFNAANDTVYGKVYDWKAVSDSRNICPVGYHIPTFNEWKTLIDNVGGQLDAAANLKAVSTLWQYYPNYMADDAYRFSALPGGLLRTVGGTGTVIFDDPGYRGAFWSSTLSGATPWYFKIESTNRGISWSDFDMNHMGMSVRCIKD